MLTTPLLSPRRRAFSPEQLEALTRLQQRCAESQLSADAEVVKTGWEAVDQRWGPRPVTLQYAESAGGPWNTIAAGLPNSGQYWWLVTGQVPKRVLLKIEVRDDADNAATFQTAQPISLEGLNPAGRIKEIRK